MSEEYKESLMTIFRHSHIGFILSLAKDVGVIDVLRSAGKPLTSQEIADQWQLKERYVREMLGCMGSAELVVVGTNENGQAVYNFSDAGKETWNGPLYAFTTMVHAISDAYNRVKACVHADGPDGVSYGDSLFQMLDEKNFYTGDGMIQMMLDWSPGLKEKLEKGISVAEFGCGYGQLIGKMAAKFPNSTFTGGEYRQDLVDKLKKRWEQIPNLHFVRLDLCAVPETITEKFDFIFVVDVIHDLPDPLEALKGICRLTKEPDGLFMAVDMVGPGSHQEDVGSQSAASLYAFGTFFCIPESYQRKESVAYGPCWPKKTATDFMKQAGFCIIDIKSLDERCATFICKVSQ